MKATGIVIRIDDLGRVVITEEIRRTMRVREGWKIMHKPAGKPVVSRFPDVSIVGDIKKNF